MAIEEEFNIVRFCFHVCKQIGTLMTQLSLSSTPQEIPDADADAIETVGQAVEYISKTSEGEQE